MKKRILRLSLAIATLPIATGVAWDFGYKGLSIGLASSSLACLAYLMIIYLDRNLYNTLSGNNSISKSPYPHPVTRKELERRKARVLTYDFKSGN